MRIDLLTLFPEMCEAVMSESIIGRARRGGFLQVCCHQIRQYAYDKHQRVDDCPFGGGKGMLMMAEPIAACIDDLTAHLGEKPHLIYMSPLGKVLNQQRVRELALADAVSRMIDGVLADSACFEEESHYAGLLEYPQYTRPAVWRGRPVPPVLLSGHHGKIADWRMGQQLLRTKTLRPDMMEKLILDRKKEKLLREAEAEAAASSQEK